MNSTSLLANSLNPQLIRVRREMSSRKKLFELMAELLRSNLDEECRQKSIYQLLWDREKIGNTGIGNGIAIPHARSEFAEQAVVAIVTLTEPIDYDAPDRQPVDLAFGLLVPEDANEHHLGLLANIARLMSDASKKEQLVAAQSPDRIVHLIQSWSNAAQESENT